MTSVGTDSPTAMAVGLKGAGLVRLLLRRSEQPAQFASVAAAFVGVLSPWQPLADMRENAALVNSKTTSSFRNCFVSIPIKRDGNRIRTAIPGRKSLQGPLILSGLVLYREDWGDDWPSYPGILDGRPPSARTEE